MEAEEKMYYWIIEHNLELQEIYKLFLTSQGHKVECFFSAEDAIRSMANKRIRPDICVIDYPLLGQNEIHIFELLHKLDASSKIIFSICDWDAKTELRNIDSIVLEKPFKLKELLLYNSEHLTNH